MGDHTGFMGFWADIDPAYEASYQEWHNCEHIPERLGVPGFAEGRRYRALEGAPRYFMCYVTAAPEVLRSEVYLAALNRPTVWTREALTHFRNAVRTLYRRHAVAGRGGGYAPYLVTLRFDADVPAADVAARIAPAVSGTSSASLYEVDEAASGIMTAERKIYSGGPGRQQYLIALEALDRADAAASEAQIRDALAGRLNDVERGLYFIETRIRAADLRTPAPQPERKVS